MLKVSSIFLSTLLHALGAGLQGLHQYPQCLLLLVGLDQWGAPAKDEQEGGGQVWSVNSLGFLLLESLQSGYISLSPRMQLLSSGPHHTTLSSGV